MKDQSVFIFLLLTSFCSLYKAQSENVCAGTWWGPVPNPVFCDRYYLCTLLVSSERSCDADMIFDPAALECVPGNSFTCEIRSETLDDTTEPPNEPSTSSSPPTRQLSKNLEEICENIFFAARPFPESDTFYVGCVRGAGVLLSCFDGEIFDYDLNECVVIPTTTTTESTRTTPRTPPNLDGICDDKFFNFIPFPEDCTQYIFCYLQKIGIFQCDPDKVYDEQIAECRAGDQSTCEFEDSTAQPTDAPTLPTTEPPNPCEGINDGFIRDEDNCANYIRCIFETPSFRTCRSGYIFSVEFEECVPGDVENCEGL